MLLAAAGSAAGSAAGAGKAVLPPRIVPALVHAAHTTSSDAERSDAFIRAWLRHHGKGASGLTVNRMAFSPDRLSSAQNEASQHLAVLQRRAEQVKRCNVPDLLRRAISSRHANVKGDAFHAASTTEIAICPAAKLAFIHVYKAAGTTIVASMHDLCKTVFGVPVYMVCTGRSSWCESSLQEAWDTIKDYSWITFVRDPIRRFESATFELARRKVRCAMDAGDAGLRGDALAQAVLDRCVLRPNGEAGEETNPHIKPQINFLLEPPGLTVSRRLSHVGHVETLDTDWPALVTKFFSAHAGASVATALRNDTLHTRSSGDDDYAANVPSEYEIEIQSANLNSSVEQAYFVDKACLGYTQRASLER